MRNIRLIARLDIKGPNLIKGVHLEGLRVLGAPNDFARNYYRQGADELIYMDVVASLYGRNHLGEMIEEAARDIFIPLTVGGGIRSAEDAREVLRSGADKVAINTAAIKDPSLISEIAHSYGSQCMVSSIEAKQVSSGKWEVYYNNGRERTGLDVVEWSKICVKKGAGEILLTSVDREGTGRGFDVDLVQAVSAAVSVPIIASGGMGSINDLIEVTEQGAADAIAIADLVHYQKSNFAKIRDEAINLGLGVRTLDNSSCDNN